MKYVRKDVTVRLLPKEMGEAIDSLPDLDIYMCKHCKRWMQMFDHGGECLAGHGMTTPEFWCRDGEEDERQAEL